MFSKKLEELFLDIGDLSSLLLELNVGLTSKFDEFGNFKKRVSTIEKNEFFAGQLGFF